MMFHQNLDDDEAVAKKATVRALVHSQTFFSVFSLSFFY